MPNTFNTGRLPDSNFLQWKSALLSSAGMTLLCVVLVGIPFLPREVGNLKDKGQIRVVHCEPLPGSDSVVILLQANSKTRLNFESSACLVVQCLGDASCHRPYATMDANLSLFALEPGGERIFMGDQRGGLFIGHVPHNTGLDYMGNTLLGHTTTSMACAPDGNTLLTLDESSLVAWSLVHQTQLNKPRWCRIDPSITCFAIYPDSQAAICARTREGQTELVEFELQRGEARVVLTNRDRQLERLAVSPNGGLVIGVNDVGDVVVLRRHDAWQPVYIPGLVTGSARIVSFSPNARVLITSNRTDDQLHVWDVDRQQLLGRLEWQENTHVKGCHFLDDNRIFSWNSDDILRVWDLPSHSLVHEQRLDHKAS